jgi:hypothetical protein
VAIEVSVVDTTGVVVELKVELTTLSVVEVEGDMDVVGLSVEAIVTDDVSVDDSTEDVATMVVELDNSCDVSEVVGFVAEFVVKTEGADSVEAVDTTALVSGWGVVDATIVELFICRIKSFV